MTQLEISYLLALKNYNLTPSADLKSCKTDIKWTKEFSCLKVKKKKKSRERWGKGDACFWKGLNCSSHLACNSLLKNNIPQPKKKPPCLYLGQGSAEGKAAGYFLWSIVPQACLPACTKHLHVLKENRWKLVQRKQASLWRSWDLEVELGHSI